ncbi:hypothetical protein HPC62_22165 [Thermoleptolyngbya sichuanensis A183]|uniref:Uncharacterized protein n=1 Tax=Thermoleptolyngbya sichuanensis A183 TaxID=2737172 RepID=A0A6M8BLG6_9CYAN|nr:MULTISPECIES: hypothetical protein [Thermoleptolyngbya]QKD84531.1 hypothetical protein HPC62_22165 [Thermoleptolyngbya sichuanensis A183]
MTEADLALAKAFLLFSVAGYTITAVNAHPQPCSVSQVVAGWADAMVIGMTGDRTTEALSSATSSMPTNPHGDVSLSFPLYLSQRPTLFSDRVSLASPPKTSPAVWQNAAQFTQGFSGLRSDQPLTLPPVLTEAGFQFQL